MSTFAYCATAFGLIVFIYGVKVLLFQFVRSSTFQFLGFLFGVALVVPVIWLISPDWKNEHVCRIAIWVGDPVGILAVPCVSFFIDFVKGCRDMRGWLIRVPLEIFVAAPVWFYTWVWIQLLVLGWVWI
jgi:hypothetical protein